MTLPLTDEQFREAYEQAMLTGSAFYVVSETGDVKVFGPSEVYLPATPKPDQKEA